MRGLFLKKPRFSNRSRIEIITCILKNCNKRSGKTRLIFKCNLNLSQLDRYRNFLVEAGLINILSLEDGKEIFKTTEKGKEFLRDCARIKGVLDNLNPQR
jgi:predicted transcriptional regulator